MKKIDADFKRLNIFDEMEKHKGRDHHKPSVEQGWSGLEQRRFKRIDNMNTTYLFDETQKHERGDDKPRVTEEYGLGWNILKWIAIEFKISVL